MRIYNLDLNLLIALNALLEEQSVTNAARRVHLSQPAISNALRRLREHFSDPLLVRAGREMMLTPLAARLREPIRDALLELEGLLFDAQDFDPAQLTRTIRVSASDYMTTLVLARLLRRLDREAPGVTVSVLAPSRLGLRSFQTGDVDLLTLPIRLARAKHPREELLRDTWALAVWSENPLVEDSLSSAQLKRLRHAIPGFYSAEPTYFPYRLLREAGAAEHVGIVMPSFTQLLESIPGTRQVATVPRRLATAFARRLPLKVLESPIDLPPLIEVVQWHRQRDHDPVLRWLRGLLMEVAHEASTEE